MCSAVFYFCSVCFAILFVDLSSSVVSQELPPAESLHQLFDSLKYLDDCVTDVFSRIQSRINVERSKIQSVVSRIDHCQQQVVKIQQNATKATTVHSIAKYPAAAQLPAYPRLADELSSTHHPAPASHTLTKEERLAKAERVDTSALFTALSDASRAESRTINRANMQQEVVYFIYTSYIFLSFFV
jgi:hypothetical protein